MPGREIAYGSLALLGLTIPWFFNLQYISQGGSVYNLIEFFGLGFANPAASSLTMDLTIAFIVFSLWVASESQRLGMRAGWVYPILGFFIAFAFAFPLFLFLRERHLRMGNKPVQNKPHL